jgi:translocation and assembly module TamA
VVERDRRFIGFGANYSTNDGGASRLIGAPQLFGRRRAAAPRCRRSGVGENEWSEINYGVTVDFLKPDFLHQRQDLHSNLALVQEYDRETFDKRARPFCSASIAGCTDTLSVSFGGEAEISEITQGSA